MQQLTLLIKSQLTVKRTHLPRHKRNTEMLFCPSLHIAPI